MNQANSRFITQLLLPGVTAAAAAASPPEAAVNKIDAAGGTEQLIP
jgi:hypothetical protein